MNKHDLPQLVVPANISPTKMGIYGYYIIYILLYIYTICIYTIYTKHIYTCIMETPFRYNYRECTGGIREHYIRLTIRLYHGSALSWNSDHDHDLEPLYPMLKLFTQELKNPIFIPLSNSISGVAPRYLLPFSDSALLWNASEPW